MKKTFIGISFKKDGFHHWLEAPDEVAFLRNSHRHLFHYEVEIEVKHDDRELEFFIVLRKFHEWIPLDKDWGSMSCEMIADDLYEFICEEYGSDRDLNIKVSEDGENWAKCLYTKNRVFVDLLSDKE